MQNFFYWLIFLVISRKVKINAIPNFTTCCLSSNVLPLASHFHFGWLKSFTTCCLYWKCTVVESDKFSPTFSKCFVSIWIWNDERIIISGYWLPFLLPTVSLSMIALLFPWQHKFYYRCVITVEALFLPFPYPSPNFRSKWESVDPWDPLLDTYAFQCFK